MRTQIQREALNIHRLANQSDPFAAARLNTHIRQGLVTDQDLVDVLTDGSYAVGARRAQARKLAAGEFLSMRKV